MADPNIRELVGTWKPITLKALYYGPGSVQRHLIASLPHQDSKVFIVTGSSLSNKTTLIKGVEQLLGQKHFANTFSKISQHAPVAQLDEATELVKQNDRIDTIISIGGGSPIDSAKAISYWVKEKTGKFLFHISIPTTISAAECTGTAGYTNEQGVKTGLFAPETVPSVIIYDSKFALETPQELWLSTGLRAVDHAMELMYHPDASELTRWQALQATSALFIYLPKYKQDPKDEYYITQLQLAAFASLGSLGYGTKGGLGLSHSLGYALGAPYQIPHGITSCMTLGHVLKLKADDPKAAAQIARMAPFIGLARTGADQSDAKLIGQAVLTLVENLGLKTTLKERGVGEDQVPIIVKRATGGLESGTVFDRVAELVKGLY